MPWTFGFYETAAGNSPVRDYIRKEASVGDQARIWEDILILGTYGPGAAGIDCKHVLGKVWELRVFAKDSHRLFYVTITGQVVMFLHANKKQTQKTRKRDLELAQKRASEVLGT